MQLQKGEERLQGENGAATPRAIRKNLQLLEAQ